MTNPVAYELICIDGTTTITKELFNKIPLANNFMKLNAESEICKVITETPYKATVDYLELLKTGSIPQRRCSHKEFRKVLKAFGDFGAKPEDVFSNLELPIAKKFAQPVTVSFGFRYSLSAKEEYYYDVPIAMIVPELKNDMTENEKQIIKELNNLYSDANRARISDVEALYEGNKDNFNTETWTNYVVRITFMDMNNVPEGVLMIGKNFKMSITKMSDLPKFLLEVYENMEKPAKFLLRLKAWDATRNHKRLQEEQQKAEEKLKEALLKQHTLIKERRKSLADEEKRLYPELQKRGIEIETPKKEDEIPSNEDKKKKKFCVIC